MQNYGLLRDVQRRGGRAAASPIDVAACVLLPVGALMWRARAVCGEYNDAPLAAPPASLAIATMAAGALAVALFLGRELLARARGHRVHAVGIALVIGTTLLWTALILGIAHPALPLYALASGHYVQYLWFVHRVERRDARRASGWLVRLTLAGGLVTLALTFVVVGARLAAGALGVRPGDALAIPPWAAAMIGVNLWHYWLDSRIWRRRPAAPASA
jgi:hypothetical protein